MAGRDGSEFAQKTIEEIGRRAGYLCSNPRCVVSTVGATTSDRGVRNIGVAAHIAGAAPGSARHDQSMTPEQRKAPENGIWLCQNHAKEVDDDPVAFSIEVLRKWKADREATGRQEVGRPQVRDAVTAAERERLPARHRALYVDYRFLLRQAVRYTREAQRRMPEREIGVPDPTQVMLSSLEWLHERSFVTVYVFASPDDEDESLLSVHGRVDEYEKGEVRFHVVVEELYEAHLGEHVVKNAIHYDDVFVIGDSAAYISPLLSLSGNRVKLVRRDNATTAFLGTELARRRWQDIDYVIASSIGLEPYEM